MSANNKNGKEKKDIKFVYQPPQLQGMTLERASKILIQIGSSDLFKKARELKKLSIVAQTIEDTDFETAALKTIHILKKIFYIVDDWNNDMEMENQFADKWIKEINPSTGKKYSVSIARRLAMQDIVWARYIDLLAMMKEEKSRVEIGNKIVNELNNAESIIVAKAANDIELSSSDKNKESKVNDFELGKVKPEDWRWMLKEENKDCSKDEESIVETIKKVYQQKVEEGSKSLKKTDNNSRNRNFRNSRNSRNSRKSRSKSNRVSQERKFVKVKKQEEIDETKKQIWEELKRKREIKEKSVEEIFNSLDSKLKEIATQCATVGLVNGNVKLGVDNEVLKSTWKELLDLKNSNSDDLLKDMLVRCQQRANDKQFNYGGVFLEWTNIIIALSNKINEIVITLNNFINYFSLIEKSKNELALLGNRASKIENKRRVQNNYKSKLNDFVDEETWKNMSAKEKISKRFVFTDRTQNPPNYLFKNLEVNDKKVFLEKKKQWREKRIVEIYNLFKIKQYSDAALAFDSFVFFKDRDKFGFKVDTSLEDNKYSEEFEKMRKELEENWIAEGRKKHIFNMIMINNKRIFTAGNRCVWRLKLGQNRYRRFKKSNFKGRKGNMLNVKRRRNGKFYNDFSYKRVNFRAEERRDERRVEEVDEKEKMDEEVVDSTNNQEGKNFQ